MRFGVVVGLSAVVCSSLGCPEVDDGVIGLPDPECHEGTAWVPGNTSYRERTAELGLTGVMGQRINAVDLDMDGDADLIVRQGGAPPVDTSLPIAERSAWIMRNDGGTFTDISAESGFFNTRNGLVPGRPGDVMSFADVDNDGDLDAYTGVTTVDGGGDGETSEIILNRIVEEGVLRFEMGEGGDIRREGELDAPAASVFFDLDRDGDVDLFVPGNHSADFDFPGNRVYENDGTGSFTDVTEALGMTCKPWNLVSDLNEGLACTRSWSGLAADLNNDGSMELMAASYGRAPNHLYQGIVGGDGIEMKNVSVDSGYARDDNYFYADNENFKCACQETPAMDALCATAGAPSIGCGTDMWGPDEDEPFRLGGNSGATMVGDLDGDGDLDLVTGEIKHWWAGSSADGAEILENISDAGGQPHLIRPGNDVTGLQIDHGNRIDWDEGVMSGTIFDFDNDGRPDVYLGASDYPGNRGVLFHNEGGGLHFTNVDTDDFFEHNRSHGIAVADFDLDGDTDVVVGHSLGRCDPNAPNNCYETANVRYFENTAGEEQNFVAVTLEGTAANRAAIGARVSVTANGFTHNQEIGGGYGHFGAQNELTQHFGLGSTCDQVDVTVRWPDAALTEEHFTVPSGHRLILTQGGGVRATP